MFAGAKKRAVRAATSGWVALYEVPSSQRISNRLIADGCQRAFRAEMRVDMNCPNFLQQGAKQRSGTASGGARVRLTKVRVLANSAETPTPVP